MSLCRIPNSAAVFSKRVGELFSVRKTVGKFQSIIGLDALHANAFTSIPLHQVFQKVGRGVGRLLWVGSQEAESGELVNRSIIEADAALDG